MKLHEAITQRVKNLLEQKGLNQYALFKQGGIPRSTISTLINFNIKKISTDLIYQICATLDISLRDFFDDPLFDNLED